MIRYTFKRVQRIHKNKEFQEIFNFGKKVLYNGLLIYVFSRENVDICRLGIVVSRKIEKSAVIRNKFKRRIREIFRLNKHKIKKGTDIVVVATKNCITQNYHQLEQNFITCLKQTGVWIENEIHS